MNARISHWLRYAIALTAHYSGLDILYRRFAGAGLVVLMLHRLQDEPDPLPLSTTRASFRTMVSWLRRRRLLVGLEEGLDALSSGRDNRVNYAITFDDGYRDNLSLLDDDLEAPPAVIYMATGHVGGEPIWVYRLHHAIESHTRHVLDLADLGLGRYDLDDPSQRQQLFDLLPPCLKQFEPEAIESHVDAIVAQTQPLSMQGGGCVMLSWHEIRDLHAQGIVIGAHTHNHALLSRVDHDTAAWEIATSRKRIAEALGTNPKHFAYPNGGSDDFGERDISLLREAGFTTAATSIEGVNRRGCDVYRILRHNVHEARFRSPVDGFSPALFFSETSGLLGWLRHRRNR